MRIARNGTRYLISESRCTHESELVLGRFGVQRGSSLYSVSVTLYALNGPIFQPPPWPKSFREGSSC